MTVIANIMRPPRWMLPAIAATLLSLSFIPYTSGESPFMLTDATFTDDVVNRQPHNRLKTFNIGTRGAHARLWFWFRVNCGEACLEETGTRPSTRIWVKWAYDEDGVFMVKRTVPLTVHGPNWRTWAYKRNLRPGTWRVAIFSEQGPLCLGAQCDFSVEVHP